MAAIATDEPLVLLVEDSRQHAELVEDMLDDQHPGMRVVRCSRVADAREVLRGVQRPDCVVMDLGLPDAEGLAGVRRLVEAAPEVPIVVLTGRDDDEMATQAVQQGAQDYLVKSRSDGYVIGRAIRYAIERKRAQLELTRHASEVRAFAEYQRDFVAAASHELRTPLTSILGYVELLLEDPDEETEIRNRHAQAAYRNCERLLALVEDLLTVNRMETGTIPLELSPVGLDELIERCREETANSCARKGLELVVEPHGGSEQVLVDAVRTGEVLENLLSNAVKFTPPGGRIRLAASVDGDHGLLTVADTGIGIASEDLPRIFDRFFRSGESVRMATPGAGLGLAIALSLVEAQNGILGVRSDLGAGSTFTVALPLAAP